MSDLFFTFLYKFILRTLALQWYLTQAPPARYQYCEENLFKIVFMPRHSISDYYWLYQGVQEQSVNKLSTLLVTEWFGTVIRNRDREHLRSSSPTCVLLNWSSTSFELAETYTCMKLAVLIADLSPDFVTSFNWSQLVSIQISGWQSLGDGIYHDNALG